MNSISTPDIYAILSRKEFLELLPTLDCSNLALISISEPVEQGWEDTELTYQQVLPFSSYARVKFWDITEPIGNYEPISDGLAHDLQQFILANLDKQFIIHCRAGQSRSAAVGKAIECIKHFGIGDEAKYNYQTSFSSTIDSHPRYSPNHTVFNQLVKEYNELTN